MNIGLIASPGGHSAQLKIIFNQEVLGHHNAVFITEVPETKKFKVIKRKSKFLGKFDEYIFKKDALKLNPFIYLYVLFALIRIYRSEKLDCIVTDGAQISIPAVLAARFCGIPSVFMDTFIRVKTPNWSARFCYYVANIFLVQHDSMRRKYGKKAIYRGSIL
jgi:UDP-N-acetylglucosamine:LPS N-acetylglucosamine transferase